MINPSKNRSGIILAGGKSSRMGTDKGFILLNNKPFIQHIIDCLQPLVDEIIIISNNAAYDVFGKKRVADKIINSGPLAGVYTGLFYSKTQNNIVLSCDVPFVNQQLLSVLLQEEKKKYDIVQLQSEGKNMPLIALYQKKCAPHFLKLLNSGEKRMNTAINQLNTKTITINATLEKFAKNINTPEDLKHGIEH